MNDRLDRRRLIGIALAAGAGLIVPARAAAATPRSEAQVLADLLATEQLTIAVAERILASPRLGHRAAATTRRVLAAERHHAAAFARALRQIGGAPAAPFGTAPTTLERALLVRHVHQSLGGLHTEKDCLDLLLDLEGIAEGALYTAMADLRDPAHQRLTAGVLASEAQHEAVFGLLRNPKDFDRAAPYAFVEGIQP